MKQRAMKTLFFPCLQSCLLLMTVFLVQYAQLPVASAQSPSTSFWYQQIPLNSSMIPIVRSNQCTVTFNGDLYMFGGYSPVPNSDLSDLWRYNFSARVWTLLTALGPQPAARNSHACASYNGLMYIHGGYCDSALPSQNCNDLFTYNPLTNTFANLTGSLSSPTPNAVNILARNGHQLIVGPNANQILFVAGWGGPNRMEYNDVWSLNTSSLVLTQISPTSVAVETFSKFGCDLSADGTMLFVIKGNSDNAIMSIYSFTIASATWNTLFMFSPPNGRLGLTAVTSGHQLWFWGGGIAVESQVTNDLYSFNTSVDHLPSPQLLAMPPNTKVPAPRYFFSASKLFFQSQMQLLIFGGQSYYGIQYFNDLWVLMVPQPGISAVTASSPAVGPAWPPSQWTCLPSLYNVPGSGCQCACGYFDLDCIGASPASITGCAYASQSCDLCGVCGGNSLSCAGCDDIPYSGTHGDICGVCGGELTTESTGLLPFSPEAVQYCARPPNPSFSYALALSITVCIQALLAWPIFWKRLKFLDLIQINKSLQVRAKINYKSLGNILALLALPSLALQISYVAFSIPLPSWQFASTLKSRFLEPFAANALVSFNTYNYPLFTSWALLFISSAVAAIILARKTSKNDNTFGVVASASASPPSDDISSSSRLMAGLQFAAISFVLPLGSGVLLLPCIRHLSFTFFCESIEEPTCTQPLQVSKMVASAVLIPLTILSTFVSLPALSTLSNDNSIRYKPTVVMFESQIRCIMAVASVFLSHSLLRIVCSLVACLLLLVIEIRAKPCLSSNAVNHWRLAFVVLAFSATCTSFIAWLIPSSGSIGTTISALFLVAVAVILVVFGVLHLMRFTNFSKLRQKLNQASGVFVLTARSNNIELMEAPLLHAKEQMNHLESEPKAWFKGVLQLEEPVQQSVLSTLSDVGSKSWKYDERSFSLLPLNTKSPETVIADLHLIIMQVLTPNELLLSGEMEYMDFLSSDSKRGKIIVAKNVMTLHEAKVEVTWKKLDST